MRRDSVSVMRASWSYRTADEPDASRVETMGSRRPICPPHECDAAKRFASVTHWRTLHASGLQQESGINRGGSIKGGADHALQACHRCRCIAVRPAARCRPGARAKTGRHVAHVSLGQPAQRLDPRGGDCLHGGAVHAAVQQPRALRSAPAAQYHRQHPARARHQLGLGRQQDQAHFQAAQRRDLARRQAVHGQGCRLHHGQAAGEGPRQLPQEPTQDLVAQPQGGDRQRRPRGDVPPRPAAGLVRGAVRHRLQPGLSLPRVGGRHAHQADRHRAFQVRRVQEQRVGEARAQPRLLAQGPPLHRRHRVARHRQPLDPRAGVRRRRVRHDAVARPDRGAGARHQIAAAQGQLRAAADQQLDQPDRQSRSGALQRSQAALGSGAVARPVPPSTTS